MSDNKGRREPKFLLGINREALGGGLSTAEYEKKRQQAQIAGIARSVVILVGLIVVTALLARRTAGPAVESVVLASGLDANFEPVGETNSFGPEDTLYVSVEALGYDPGMDVIARLRREGEIVTQLPVDEGMVSERYIGWAFDPAEAGLEAWEPGTYVVEILFRERLGLGSAQFRVMSDE